MSTGRRDERAPKKASSAAAKGAPAVEKKQATAPESPMHISLSLPMLVVIAIGVFALLVAIGYVFTAPVAVLLLAALALMGVISFFWSSLRTLLGETRLSGADAYAIGAPRLEEEQKRAVLRALKDLEFERAVGKISDDDYRQLAVRYRDEAKRLLRLIDENAAADRERAQGIVTSMLIEEGLVGPDGGDLDAPDANPKADPATTEAGSTDADSQSDASPSGGDGTQSGDPVDTKDATSDADDAVHAETKETATRD